ncbi:serine hydrolase, partial [Streptomyces hirsutus]
MTIAVSMVLLSMAPPVSSALSAPPPDTLLPLLVTQGGAPAAALLAVDESGPVQALAGEGLNRGGPSRPRRQTKT